MRLDKNILVRLTITTVLALISSEYRADTQTFASPPDGRQPAIQAVKVPQADGFQLDDRKGFVVPFEYEINDQPLLTVRARVGKSSPYTFLVDTGVPQQIVIFTWAQRQLNLPLTGKTAKVIPGNFNALLTKEFDITLLGKGDNNDVEAPISEGEVVDFPVVQGLFHRRIAGIIGGPELLSVTTRYDFDKKTLTFFTDKHPPVQPRGIYSSVKLLPAPDGSRDRISVKLPGMEPIPFAIDTGGLLTILPARAGSHLEKLAFRSSSYTDIAGEHPTIEVLAPKLNIGDLSQPLPAVTLMQSAIEPLLGMDILTHFTVTIDPENLLVTFEPRKDVAYRRVGEIGFEYSGPPDAVAITRITDPHVSRAGLDVGDVIQSVDGHPVSDMNALQAYYYLRNYEGTVARVVLQKSDKRSVTVNLPRRSRFPTVAAGLAGMTVLKESNKNGQVLEVEPGSQADKAGVHSGDEIVLVNGKSILDTAANQLEDLIVPASSGCQLEVKRKGSGASAMIKLGS